MLLAVALALLVLLTIGVAQGWRPVDRLDHTVAPWGFHATYRHPGLVAWWTAVARWGQPLVLRVLLVGLGVLMAIRGRRGLAVWLVGVAVAEQVLGPASKYLLNRSRPHWAHPLAVEHSTSYPSGHAAGAAMFATAVALLALTIMRAGTARRVVIAFAVLAAAVICADRILLGVHYLSDVLGGVLLGFVISWSGWLLLLRHQRRHGGAGSRP